VTPPVRNLRSMPSNQRSPSGGVVLVKVASVSLLSEIAAGGDVGVDLCLGAEAELDVLHDAERQGLHFGGGEDALWHHADKRQRNRGIDMRQTAATRQF
jgi:hypothetical protein